MNYLVVPTEFYQCNQVAANSNEISSSSTHFSPDNTCFCCLTGDVPLIKMSSCSHNGYLMCCFYNKITLKTMLCNYCHNILKKIEWFKKQVEECILYREQLITTNTIRNLQKSEVVTTSIIPEDEKPDIANIFIPEATINDTNVDIKEEYFSDESTRSAFEQDMEELIPAWQVDDKKEKKDDKKTVDMLKTPDVTDKPNVMEFRKAHQKPNFKMQEAIDHSYAAAECVPTKPASKKKTKTAFDIKPSTSETLNTYEKLTVVRSGTYTNPQPGRLLKPRSIQRPRRSSNRIQHLKILPKVDTQKPTFECSLCSAKFDVKWVYDNHVKEHKNVKYARRDLYGKIQMIYLNKEEMELERERKRAAFADCAYKCENCLIGFELEENLMSHMAIHDQSKSKYVCEVCKRVYATRSSLKTHEDTHWKRYKCMVCGEKFTQDVKCILHYNKEHGSDGNTIEDYYSCRHLDCDFIANNIYAYKAHKRKMHSKRIPCDVCNNIFMSFGAMRQHKTIPSASDCMQNECLSTPLLSHFPSVNCASRVVHDKTNEPKKTHKCKICNKLYKSKGGLVAHIRTHNDHINKDLPYCKQCDKIFYSKSSLQSHYTNHSRHITEENKKYTCDYCRQKFAFKSTLRAHIEKIHMALTFQCAVCKKVSSCSRAHEDHMKRNHSDAPKPPPEKKLCQICGKGFKHVTSLEFHMFSHTGERPFKCAQCPATFAYKAARYTHNRLVHKVPKKNNNL